MTDLDILDSNITIRCHNPAASDKTDDTSIVVRGRNYGRVRPCNITDIAGPDGLDVHIPIAVIGDYEMADIATIRHCQKHDRQIAFTPRREGLRAGIPQCEKPVAVGFLDLVDIIENATNQNVVALVKLPVVQGARTDTIHHTQ